MSTSYTNRKKAKRRSIQKEIVEMEFGRVPEHLWDLYPGKDAKFILEARKALLTYQSMIKRMIKQGKISRYIIAKDGNGRCLYRGKYKFNKSGETLVVGSHFIQKFVGDELRRQAEERNGK